MKPCLINVFSQRSEDNPFFQSIEPFKDSFDHQVTSLPVYPGNVQRFFLIPEITDDNGWYIFTDTSDVIMQAPIPSLEGIKGSIIVANENEIHANSFWGEYMKGEFASLADKTIYNAGSFAMRGKQLKEFIALLEKHTQKPHLPFVDQLVLNLFCQKNKTLLVEHPTLFTTLYANMDKGIIMKRGNQWINSSLQPFVFVHANGSYKKFL